MCVVDNWLISFNCEWASYAIFYQPSSNIHPRKISPVPPARTPTSPKNNTIPNSSSTPTTTADHARNKCASCAPKCMYRTIAPSIVMLLASSKSQSLPGIGKFVRFQHRIPHGDLTRKFEMHLRQTSQPRSHSRYLRCLRSSTCITIKASCSDACHE